MVAQDLELVVKRMTKLTGVGTLKAFCDIAVGEAFLIKSFKVVDGKKGLFVSMPREQGKNGQWYDTVVPLSQDVKEQLGRVVLEAYEAEAS